MIYHIKKGFFLNNSNYYNMCIWNHILLPYFLKFSSILSTSPPKNHAVLYVRAIYRMSQISIFFFFFFFGGGGGVAWSASFRWLKLENTIKSFNMTCVATRIRVRSISHFLTKFAMLHRCQTLYFEGIKMLLNFNIYRNWLLFSIHLK